MNNNVKPWAVVLAGGSGNRLSSLTRAADGGAPIPKQYCSLVGGATLLEDALVRAQRLTSSAHTVTIVASEHSVWWRPQLATLPNRNVLVQPRNRGTAIGILLTALHIYRRAPESTLVFLPSDHFIRDENIIDECLLKGVDYLDSDPDSLLIIGITPDDVDPELGYIVPGKHNSTGIFGVNRFIEKPDRVAAQALLAAGSVWNSFIFAVRARTLLQMFVRSAPVTLDAMHRALTRDDWSAAEGHALGELYESLGDSDFSRHILEGNEAMLRVLPAPRCGWTDLGTPQRVGKCVAQLGARHLTRAVPRASLATSFINLAAAYSSLSPAD